MPATDWVLSQECIERFEVWVLAHYPCAFADPQCEFFRGLLCICDEELLTALARERERLQRTLSQPSPQ